MMSSSTKSSLTDSSSSSTSFSDSSATSSSSSSYSSNSLECSSSTLNKKTKKPFMVHSSTDGQIHHRVLTTTALLPGMAAFGSLFHNKGTLVRNKVHKRCTSSSSTPILSSTTVINSSSSSVVSTSSSQMESIFRWILSRKNKTISSSKKHKDRNGDRRKRPSSPCSYMTWTPNNNQNNKVERNQGSPLRESYSFDDIDSLIQMTLDKKTSFGKKRMPKKMPSISCRAGDNNNKHMLLSRDLQRTTTKMTSSFKRKSMTISCPEDSEQEEQREELDRETQKEVLESSFKQKTTSNLTSKVALREEEHNGSDQEKMTRFEEAKVLSEQHERKSCSVSNECLKRRLSSSSLFSRRTLGNPDSEQRLLTVNDDDFQEGEAESHLEDDEDKRHVYLRENHMEYDYGSVKSRESIISAHHDKCCCSSKRNSTGLKDHQLQCNTRNSSHGNVINKSKKQQHILRIGVNDAEQSVLFEEDEDNDHQDMSSVLRKSCQEVLCKNMESFKSIIRSKSNSCLNNISRRKLIQRRSLTFEPNSFLACRLEEEDIDCNQDQEENQEHLICLLCLDSLPSNTFFSISSCGCKFCTECLSHYVTYNINNNLNVTSSLSCPDPKCPLVVNNMHKKQQSHATPSKKSSPIKKLLSPFKTKKTGIPESNKQSSCNQSTNNQLTEEDIKRLVDSKTLCLYQKRVVEDVVNADSNLVFCPTVDCGHICTVVQRSDTPSKDSMSRSASSSIFASVSPSAASVVILSQKRRDRSRSAKQEESTSVHCDSCNVTFCLKCRKTVHEGKDCHDNDISNSKTLPNKPLKSSSSRTSIASLLDNNPDSSAEIKKCPKCCVYIERDAGCAQMMCRKCKHVFCWFCLKSLEDDYLLRHYDSGSCKNKLGHSRLSVFWHRTQVIGIFAGFGLLLLTLSPLFLVAAPCLLCCNSCSCLGKSFKRIINIDDQEDDKGSRTSSMNTKTQVSMKSRKSSVTPHPEDDDLIILEIWEL